MGCSGSKSTGVDSQSTSKIVLHYFVVRVRAEPIRLLLHYGGIKFEDKRYTMEQWMEMTKKGEFRGPFGVLPYVEYNGEILGQSIAILRFAARSVGAFGENAVETAQADSIADTVTELVEPLSGLLLMKPDDMEEQLKTLYAATIVTSMKMLENQISTTNDGKTGYLVGKKITHADFMVFNIMETIEKTYQKDDLDIYAEFPLLKGHRDLIKNLPQLQKYLNSRPDLPL
ncbi:putative glutathione S-transferase 6 [Saccoglossus kowalevskii]|uniref:Probable glutathione S-transferase 6-like n=1 Tax=Saccoglossus kowalevskii TaxID=10224 RepID=A0ABM0GNL2_SACKO|nr:PREDICTED: probable glutathione S-transferase 6-like [Saccoglossus kowalevskii]